MLPGMIHEETGLFRCLKAQENDPQSFGGIVKKVHPVSRLFIKAFAELEGRKKSDRAALIYRERGGIGGRVF